MLFTGKKLLRKVPIAFGLTFTGAIILEECQDVVYLPLWSISRIPCRVASRAWGGLTSMDIPIPFRRSVFGLYSIVTGANLAEAKDDLESYRSLSSLFVRELKPGIHCVSESSDLVSPVDGRIIQVKRVDDRSKAAKLIHAKGVEYSISSLIGQEDGRCEFLSDDGKDTWAFTIYLSPKDYHRVHGAAHWKISECVHISGALFPVNPMFSEFFPQVFTKNERVVLTGDWRFGKFALVAVGSFNVGSIRLLGELEKANFIQTNVMKDDLNFFNGPTFVNRGSLVPNLFISPEQQLAYFNFGSTVVLIFQVPKDAFHCSVVSGQTIRMGEELGVITV